MSTSVKPYHHGDLRAALLAAAIEGLEAGEPFSLRAVARRAGVSPTAPYRHFADREALDSAVAIEGFRDLRVDLEAALAGSTEPAAPAAPEEVITALGVAYVAFALRRPAVFRLMFGNECDQEDSDRVHASEQLHQMLNQSIASLFPGANNPNLSIALWSVAHGLAFLHLDGKLRPQTSDDVAARVKSAVGALFALNNNTSGG
ncbi:transcriptional regulator, TetR family [Arthrobacter sp. yr096]|uniref:TetR/AcrR family transcriptional regulator n=1 Tax=Arthrobacter sp. yr096 TaxID=1761750 RepID=UPI0008C82DBD|nr:TetR-like C-terminal domain-containing protein [Arthrobacter sp. yr096]SEI98188.1 transcriptional regulator, TetR family [Arthrobacter sp. yr096]